MKLNINDHWNVTDNKTHYIKNINLMKTVVLNYLLMVDTVNVLGLLFQVEFKRGSKYNLIKMVRTYKYAYRKNLQNGRTA
jgi:hypothetical protein